MVYLKATAVGVLGAALCAVLWFVGALALPLMWQMWAERDQRAAGIGAVSAGSGAILLAALIGFVLSFAWVVRRS
jgi:hypothetical protein